MHVRTTVATAVFATCAPLLANAGDHDLLMTIGLQGYSPVSYVDDQRAEPGSPLITAEHDGVTYLFASPGQRDKFVANPERYLPAYGGYCAYGCAVGGKFTPNPKSFKLINGRTHLFIHNDEVDTKALWNKEEPDMRQKADRFWARQTGSRAYLGARNLPASGLALDGYSPVSYFTVGRAEKGDPRFQIEHEGVIYHFTSAEQLEQFKQDPARYTPAYGGWCAFGMAVQDKFPVDPTRFKIVNGRLMLFLNNAQVDALSLWEKGAESELMRKADAHWKKVSG